LRLCRVAVGRGSSERKMSEMLAETERAKGGNPNLPTSNHTLPVEPTLAEAKHMQAEVRDYPIILLDDIFSELDLERRKHLLALVTLYQQVLVTATDLDCFEPSFLAGAMRFRVSQGNIESA